MLSLGDAAPASARRIVAKAVAANLLNPKLTLFFFALYGVAAAAVRRQLIGRPRVVLYARRVFAASFAALGARLALTAR
ncbi:MAG TPA: hypothetical protein VF155_03395 [Candidatus Dormibacteraeota bacterium]